jgi:hypothetical protein
LNYAKRGLITIIVAFLATALVGAATPLPDPDWPDCFKYHGDACSASLGRWLPRYDDAWQAAREGQATLTPVHDYIVYGRPPKAPLLLGGVAPTDGTFFVYGNAGPPKGYVVYDRRNKIAFYHEGCCGWGSTVVASGVGSPPKRVVNRDLSTLHTKYGVRLGDSPMRVKRVYGGATLWILKGHPELRRLSYMAPLPPPKPPLHATCGLSYEFVFERGKLIFIDLLGGC